MNDIRASHPDLQAMAKQFMLENGFEPDFPPEVPRQLAELKAHPPQVAPGADVRDLRNLLWSSIDNDTSRDLDQIEVAERLPNGDIKVLIGIADVDAFVGKSSPMISMPPKKPPRFMRVSGFFPCCRKNSLPAPARCWRMATS